MSLTFLPRGPMDELCVPWCTAYSLACCESCLSLVPSPPLYCMVRRCCTGIGSPVSPGCTCHITSQRWYSSLAEAARIHYIQIEKSEAMEDWDGVQW